MPFYGNASKRHTGPDGDPRLGEQPGRDVSACCVIGERVGISQRVRFSQRMRKHLPQNNAFCAIKGGWVMSQAESNTNWKSLYRVGGTAALIIAVLLPFEIIVFAAWPQPKCFHVDYAAVVCG